MRSIDAAEAPYPFGRVRRLLPATALVAELSACAVPLVPPHRFDHAAAPDIHTVLLLEPKFIHQSATTNVLTVVPSYGGPMLLGIPTREGQPQSVCGVPELDMPRVPRGDGSAGGTALAERVFTDRLKSDLTAKGYEVLTTPLYGAHTWDAYLVIDPAWFDCPNILAWHLGSRKGLQLNVKAELVRQSDRHSLMLVVVESSPVPPIVLPNYGVEMPDDPARSYQVPKTPAEQQPVVATFQRMIEQAADMVASFME